VLRHWYKYTFHLYDRKRTENPSKEAYTYRGNGASFGVEIIAFDRKASFKITCR